MAKFKLEYIWLDGYTPTPSLRGKTQIKEFDKFPTLEQLPLWGFDGSSTMQAEGHSSDCVLKPVAVYPDAARENGALVMCEVMMPDGVTPHESNARATILDDEGAWFGFEQEYFFYKDGRPLGFPESGYPAPQGPYYTGVGYKNVGSVAREIVEEHLDQCLVGVAVVQWPRPADERPREAHRERPRQHDEAGLPRSHLRERGEQSLAPARDRGPATDVRPGLLGLRGRRGRRFLEGDDRQQPRARDRPQHVHAEDQHHHPGALRDGRDAQHVGLRHRELA